MKDDYTSHINNLIYLKLPPLTLVCIFEILLRTSSLSLINSSYFQLKICPNFSVLWEETVLDVDSIHRKDKAGVSPDFTFL